MKGQKGSELFLTTENTVGKLGGVSELLKDSGVDVRAISAWADSGKAFFRLITSDNAKAKEILTGLGSIQEEAVVLVDMPDEVGQLNSLCSKLKDNNIDLIYIYGTTFELGKSATIVFSSSDNDKALDIISS